MRGRQKRTSSNSPCPPRCITGTTRPSFRTCGSIIRAYFCNNSELMTKQLNKVCYKGPTQVNLKNTSTLTQSSFKTSNWISPTFQVLQNTDLFPHFLLVSSQRCLNYYSYTQPIQLIDILTRRATKCQRDISSPLLSGMHFDAVSSVFLPRTSTEYKVQVS